jgi:hypothetical protein
LEADKAVIALESFDQHSDVRPISRPDFVAEVDAAIDRVEAPATTIYPQNGRFVMSDDYNDFFAYQEFRMQGIPCAVLGRATGAHVRHRRPTSAQQI